MKSKVFQSLAIVALSSFVVTLASLSLGLAAEKLAWGVHFRRNPLYGMPALAARDKGFWKKQGLNVDVVEFASAGLLEQAYAAGSLNVGTTGMPDVAVSASRGGTQVMVADPKMVVDFVLWVNINSPIRKAADLKGTKIGLSRKGISPHILAIAALKRLGIEGKVKFLALGGGQPAIAALKTGAVDSIAFSNFTLLSLKAKGEARIGVNLSKFVPGAKVAGSQAITAHRDYVKKKPESVRRAIRGYMSGAAFVLKNRDWSVQKVVSHYRWSKQAAQLAAAQFSYGPGARIDVSKLKAAIQFLVDNGLLAKEKVPPLKSLYVPGLAD